LELEEGKVATVVEQRRKVASKKIENSIVLEKIETFPIQILNLFVI
jgi:hypothetical protein